jgi:hypothetical protein
MHGILYMLRCSLAQPFAREEKQPKKRNARFGHLLTCFGRVPNTVAPRFYWHLKREKWGQRGWVLGGGTERKRCERGGRRANERAKERMRVERKSLRASEGARGEEREGGGYGK